MLILKLCLLIVLLHASEIACEVDILAEKKPTNDSEPWWFNTIIYQVYPRSFQDSNNDGVGDLKGITRRLDHFVDLGIETLWIGPIFKSPMDDMGYDVENYTVIDPLFGTMEDFDELISEMNKRNLKFITDFIPNHSSEKCQWFQKSIKRALKYSEYYIWRDAKNQDEILKNASVTPIVPNNWLSVFGYSAWEWNEVRKQFYLHSFKRSQPDFNLRNPDVRNEFLDIFKFWMDKGVSGFRLDATMFLFKNETFEDEIYIKGREGSPLYNDMNHIYTNNQPEVLDILYEWRHFIDNYTKTYNTFPRMVASEAYTRIDILMKYYGNSTHSGSQIPFNFGLVTSIDKNNMIESVDRNIRNWIEHMPQNEVANWVIENHDVGRISYKYGAETSPIFTALKLALPGIEVTYYGSEIGLVDTFVRTDQVQDPNLDPKVSTIFRDTSRCPMQWDSSINAGFTQARKSWLPVNPNYYKDNVDTQKKISTSNYNLYKKMSHLRKTNTLKYGSLQSYNLTQSIYIIKRSLSAHESYFVVMNFGSELETVILSNAIRNLNDKLYVFLGSENSAYSEGSIISTNTAAENPLVLRPKSVVVLTDKDIRLDTPNSIKNGSAKFDSKLLCNILIIFLVLNIYSFIL